MLLLSSLHLLLVGLRCGKRLQEIRSHRLSGSGASAGTVVALALCCGSQTTLLVSSPRTWHEGGVAQVAQGKYNCFVLSFVPCCAALEQLALAF